MLAKCTLPSRPTTSEKDSGCQLRCPVCTGPLLPLRGELRCGRCAFTFCEGCEGGASAPGHGEHE
jgi:hypothetical protein